MEEQVQYFISNKNRIFKKGNAMTIVPALWKGKIPFILLMIGSVLFYGITIFSNLDSFKGDVDHYKRLAVNLRVYGVYGFGDRPTAYRPPLYPILLTTASYVTGLLPESVNIKYLGDRLPYQVPAGLNFLFAVLTVALTYRIGRRLGLTQLIAVMASLFILLDPATHHSVQISMGETTATFLMVLLIDQLLTLEQIQRYRSLKIFFIGLLFGIAALCRPNFLVYGLLCVPFIVLLEWFRTRSFRAIISGVLLLAGIACFILPWGIRNQRQLGRFIPTTTHGGMTLFMVNNNPYYNGMTFVSNRIAKILFMVSRNPYYKNLLEQDNKSPYSAEVNDIAVQIYQRLQIPIAPQYRENHLEMWVMPSIITHPEQEWILDDAYYAEAKQTIITRKIDFIKATINRFILFWYPVTSGALSVDCYLKLIEFLMMFCGIFFLGRKVFLTHKNCLFEQATLAAGCWLVLSILSIQLPLLCFNVDMPRMRVPLMPTIAILAAYGLYSLIEAYRKKRASKQENPNLS